MATLPIPSLSFIESDGTDNDDWITDHAGDPQEIVVGSYTEGVDYLSLTKWTNVQIAPVTGVEFENVGSGISYDKKIGKRFYTFKVTGIAESLADADKIDKFFMGLRHTEGTGFSRFYLILKTADDTYKKFTDHNDARKEYLACNTANCRLMLSDQDNLIWKYEITGSSVWR